MKPTDFPPDCGEATRRPPSLRSRNSKIPGAVAADKKLRISDGGELDLKLVILSKTLPSTVAEALVSEASSPTGNRKATQKKLKVGELQLEASSVHPNPDQPEVVCSGKSNHVHGGAAS